MKLVHLKARIHESRQRIGKATRRWIKSGVLIRLAKRNPSENRGLTSSFCSIPFGIDRNICKLRQPKEIGHLLMFPCNASGFSSKPI